MKTMLYPIVTLSIALSCNKPKSSAENPAAAPMAPVSEEAKPGADASPTAPDLSTPLEKRPLAATVATHTFDCSVLESGIYWFGKGDSAQKSSATTRATFFDPSKPTVIYIHGWQANSHKLQRRATFNYSKTDPFEGLKVDAADAWINSGWNIGIYYWNQISDELTPGFAENKIWGTKPVTWKNCSGKAMPVEGAPASVVDQLYDVYKVALKDYRGPNVRLVGHSLGNQLATKLAEKLLAEAEAKKVDPLLVPKRVALIDPWWSATNTFNSRAPTLKTSIESMKAKGIIFEWYKASDVTENSRSSENTGLLPIIGRTETAADYYSIGNQASRHMAAPFLYFLSFGDPAPQGCAAPCADTAPSAATSDARMLELMNKGTTWRQVGGRATAVTGDNTFISLPK